MKLSHNSIHDLDDYLYYFDFAQVWKIPAEYEALARSSQSGFSRGYGNAILTRRILALWKYCLWLENWSGEQESVPLPTVVRETVGAQGVQLPQALQAILAEQEKALKIDLSGKNAKANAIDFGNVQNGGLKKQLQTAYHQNEQACAAEAKAQMDSVWQQNLPQLREMTEEWKLVESEAGLALVSLFLLLHLQADRNIDPQNLPAMRDSLAALEEQYRAYAFSKKASDNITRIEIASASADPRLLPAYVPSEKKNAVPMQAVEIVNRTQTPVTVQLGGGLRQRMLAPGKGVYVLRKHREYIDFLPEEFCFKGDWFTAQGNEILINAGASQRASFPETPVSWAFTERLGLVAVDKNGGIHNCWSEGEVSFPEKKAVRISAYLESYCLLFADGTVKSNLPGMNGQSHIIHAQAGLNNAIAICEDGSVLLAKGEKPAMGGTAAVDAQVYGSRYLWLDATGGLHSDGDISCEEPVQCIAVGAGGYAAAAGSRVHLWDLSGAHRVTELPERIHRLAVWNDQLFACTFSGRTQLRW